MPNSTQTIPVLALAARTTTQTSRDYSGLGASGCRIVVDVTAQTATPSVVLTLQGLDALSGKYYDVLVATAITDVTGVGTYVYKVFPGATPSSGAVANDVLPGAWRVKMTVSDTDSMTYSLAVELLYV